MRNWHNTLILATIILSPAPALLAQSTPSVPSAMLSTRQKTFVIPVSVNRSQLPVPPVEVQLLVSGDQGKTWSVYARQKPDATGFPFQTRDDGEYWFASRTVDAAGRVQGAAEVTPELKIAIDSTPPKIDLEVAAVGSKELKAAWRVTDAGPLSGTVKLEYRAGDATNSVWQEVALDPATFQRQGNVLSGTVNWQASTSHRVLDVRLVAGDQAGNWHAQVERVFLPRVAQQPPAPLVPDWLKLPGLKLPGGQAPSTTGDPFTSRLAATPSSPAAATTAAPATPPSPAPPNQPTATGETWPSDNQPVIASRPTDAALPREALPSATSPTAPAVTAEVSSPAGAAPSDASPSPSLPAISSPPNSASAEPAPLSPQAELVRQGEVPSAADPPNVPSSEPVVGTDSLASAEPFTGNAKPLLVNRKAFALEYDLDAIGPAGVKSVELWVTADNGASWRKWGDDADRRSPFEIEVESERMFGFRMVIVSQNGLATRPPEPGDTADVWVQVDSTPPAVRLDQAAYGEREHAGQLDIRWQADDLHLGSRPVTLLFSESPEGPWTTFAAGLPNSGQHYWTIDPRTPRQLFLRIEVRDDAGNLGHAQTNEPVSLEGLAPKGRIRAVAPQSTSGAAKPPFARPLFR